MSFLTNLFKRKKKAPQIIAIPKPTLGVFNLLGAEEAELMPQDDQVLGPLFPPYETRTDWPPTCNILLTYAHLREDGQVEGIASSWVKMLRDSGAQIIIFASENDPQSYMAASKNDPSLAAVKANLVFTINRKGAVFGHFFEKLFKAMYAGVPMPVAWVRLAPQIPGREHLDCPEAIFVPQLGQITFAEEEAVIAG